MQFVNYSEMGKMLILAKAPYSKIYSCQATVATTLTPAMYPQLKRKFLEILKEFHRHSRNEPKTSRTKGKLFNT